VGTPALPPIDEGQAEVVVDPDAWPQTRHSALTAEGAIESAGLFARGANRATGWRYWVAVFLVLTLALPLAIGIVIWIVKIGSLILGS
jgi:hypothetical protein